MDAIKIFLKELEANKPFSSGEIILDIIRKDVLSGRKRNLRKGELYYKNKTDIQAKNFNALVVDKVEEINPNHPNIRTSQGKSAYFSDLKNNMLLSIPPSITYLDEGGEINKEVSSILNRELPIDWHEKLFDASLNSINGGRSWLHPEFTSSNEFQIIAISDFECIPIYDRNNPNELEVFIRYYLQELIDGEGNAFNGYRVEVWTKEDVTYFEQEEKDGDLRLATDNIITDSMGNPVLNDQGQIQFVQIPHFKTIISGLDAENEQPHSWGKVPWIKIANNTEEEPDLLKYKGILDELEYITSKFGNEVSIHSSSILKFFFAGKQSLSELIRNTWVSGGVKFQNKDESEDLESIDRNLDFQSVESKVKQLMSDLFIAAQSVDPRQVSEGTNNTGVAVKLKFIPLTLNVTKTGVKLVSAIKQLFYFFQIYAEVLNIRELSGFDYRNIQVSLNLNEIQNISEIVTNLVNSTWMSDETKRDLDPRIQDPTKEYERIKAENELLDNIMPAEEDATTEK